MLRSGGKINKATKNVRQTTRVLRSGRKINKATKNVRQTPRVLRSGRKINKGKKNQQREEKSTKGKKRQTNANSAVQRQFAHRPESAHMNVDQPDDLVTVLIKYSVVYERRVTPELFQLLPRLQAVHPAQGGKLS